MILLCSASFIFHVRAVCDVILGNTVETDRQAGRPQMVMWRMCIACWLTKSTETHSECVRNAYRYTTTRIVTLTRLNVTLYVITCPVEC